MILSHVAGDVWAICANRLVKVPEKESKAMILSCEKNIIGVFTRRLTPNCRGILAFWFSVEQSVNRR